MQRFFQEVDFKRYGTLWARSDPKILRASQSGLVATNHRTDRQGATLVFLEIEDKNLVGRLSRQEYEDFSEHLSKCRQPEDLFRKLCE